MLNITRKAWLSQLFGKWFLKAYKSPLYRKLCRCLQERQFRCRIQSVYYLFCVPYCAENVHIIQEAVGDAKSLEELREKSQYDVQTDTIEIYFLVDAEDNRFFILLLDPVEFSEKERVLAIIPFHRRVALYGHLLYVSTR
jgi:hypothetical protein